MGTVSQMDDFLEHYGVKGMKWGVRKDYKTAGSSTNTKGDYDALVVPAMYVGTIMALIGTKKALNYADSGKVRENRERAKAFVTRNPATNWKTNPKLASKSLSPDQIHSQVVKQINPGFGAPGTKMNCRRCTMAYEMRRRGYDVSATKSRLASGQDAAGLRNATSPGKREMHSALTGYMFNKQFREQLKKTDGYGERKLPANSKAIFDHIAKQPKGSRGEITIGFAMGGRHSIAYENVKGKAVVFDTQSGKMFDAKSFEKQWPSKVLIGAGATRLDTAPINKEFLLRWIQNAET